MILKVPLLYNTAARSKQPLETLQPERVMLYCCGPTVYARAHIGNLRTYIFEDLLCRTLRLLGYTVKHVMNVTDIGHLSEDTDDGEDKIVRSAREQHTTVTAISKHFTECFFEDADLLNIARPTVVCKATDHIADMISLVEKLERQGYAYHAGANVYFDTSRFPRYGDLAGLDLDKQQSGARVAVDPNKRSPHDFVLWFTQSKFERHAMRWDSPWGVGYPGWHLECSAMSMRWLGDRFDIHCGGVDHIPVHHTNEIAQSESIVGAPWVRYWLHGEFLIMNSSKMAKSRSGAVTLPDLIQQGYHPLDYRYLCLGAHYKSQLQWSQSAMQSARRARQKLSDIAQDLLQKCGSIPQAPNETELSAAAARYYRGGISAVADNLNSPQLLAQIWGLCKDRALSHREQLTLLLFFDRALALSLETVDSSLNEATPEDTALVETLVTQREEARQRRDWKSADAIRARLSEMGVEVQDSAHHSTWKRTQPARANPKEGTEPPTRT